MDKVCVLSCFGATAVYSAPGGPAPGPRTALTTFGAIGPRGAGTLFSWGGGGGKNVDMPSDCHNLGGAQAYSSH